MDDLILITGAARSGISLIAGIVQLCGAWGGQTVRSTGVDKYDSLENVEIQDSVVKPFLRGIRADPSGQCPLPDLKTCHNLADKVGSWWRQRVKKIIGNQGYGGEPLFFASPLSCLIWPVWATAFPQARWIIVRRSDEDIVRACIKTGFMVKYKRKEEWQQWLNVYKWRFTEMISEHLNVWQIWPQRMIQGKLPQLREMIESLNLRWDPVAIQDYITPILWKKGVFEISK